MLQRESIAKSLGKDVATMSKLVGEHGKLGKQKSFGDMMGEDALSTLTSIINKIKSMGAVIVQNVAPHIEKMVDKFKDWLENSGGMETMVGYANGLAQGIVFAFKAIVKIMNALPEIIKLFLILKTISIASAIASIWKGAMESSSKIPFIGAAIGIAAAGVATGMMISSINSVGDMISPSDGKTQVSTKEGGLFELSKNDDLLAGPGLSKNIGGGVANETNINISTEKLEKENQMMKDEMIALRKDMKTYFGFGGTVAKQMGNETGRRLTSNVNTL